MKWADHVRQVSAGSLDVGYVDIGPRDGGTVILLHGWPYDIHSFADAAQLLSSRGHRVIVPYLRGFGTTRLVGASDPRNAQQARLALDVIHLMDALGIKSAVVGGCDWGSRAAACVAALWPERCSGLVLVSGYLISGQETGQIALPPTAELSWWYQFYFATDRGRRGYAEYRRDFAKLIWRTASPSWSFDNETFARTAAAFDNPDHAAIVIHNYRWRLGLAPGEPDLDEFEKRLASRPILSTPTITLEGASNGAPHPEPASYREYFAGPYEHRFLDGGIGHNLPQEAPAAFSEAVADVMRWARNGIR